MLTELDAQIGDADHGANMHRGMQAVLAEIDTGEYADPAALLKQVGMTLVRSVGGASGPLYGTLFLRMATASDGSLDAAGFAKALRAGLEGVVGDALRTASVAADAGRDATVPLQARKGRASYLGERSVGHQDPGATSTALLVAAAAEAFADV